MMSLFMTLLVGGVSSLSASAADLNLPCKLQAKDLTSLSTVLEISERDLPNYLNNLPTADKEALCVARKFLRIIYQSRAEKRKVTLVKFNDKYLTEDELDLIDDTLADPSLKNPPLQLQP